MHGLSQIEIMNRNAASHEAERAGERRATIAYYNGALDALKNVRDVLQNTPQDIDIVADYVSEKIEYYTNAKRGTA